MFKVEFTPGLSTNRVKRLYERWPRFFRFILVLIIPTKSACVNSRSDFTAVYLANAVQTVVPHDMADVLMEGQRLMKQSVQSFLAHGYSGGIETLSEQIATIACTGCVKENYRPVTTAGDDSAYEANLTKLELVAPAQMTFITQVVTSAEISASLVASYALACTGGTAKSNIQNTFLRAYYSSTPDLKAYECTTSRNWPLLYLRHKPHSGAFTGDPT